MVEIEQLTDTHHHTAEGPLWHSEEEQLYWVDIPAGDLYRYNPTSDEHERVYTTDERPLGGFTIEADGALLLFTDEIISRWDHESGTAEPVAKVQTDTRFNDVIADPEGRVFAGTMPSENELGSLYRVDPDSSSRVVAQSVDIANGMGSPGTRRRSTSPSPRLGRSTRSITIDELAIFRTDSQRSKRQSVTAFRME